MNIRILALFIFSQGLVSCQQESKINVPPSDDKSFKTLAASLKDSATSETSASNLFFSESLVSTCCKQAAVQAPIYRSTDGGQTWQDASAGLPQGLEIGTIFGTSGDMTFLGSENGLHLSSKSGESPSWRKDFSLNERIDGIFPGDERIIRALLQAWLFSANAGHGHLVARFSGYEK